MYTTDYNDYIPYTSWSSDTFNVANWMYMRVATNRPDHTVERGLLWPYHQAKNLYWCPLDKTNTTYFKLRDMKVGSYVMNGAVSGYSTGPRGAYDLPDGRTDRMLYWEPDEQPSYFDNVASIPDEGVTQRHNTGTVMGMFGGQTEYMKFKTYYIEAGIGGYPGSGPDSSGAIPDRAGATDRGRHRPDRTPHTQESSHEP